MVPGGDEMILQSAQRDARWDETRKIVLERDSGRCVRCGSNAEHVHHRHPKGLGGTSDEYIKYGPANCVSLCFSCHNWVHGHPSLAYETGFLVKRGAGPEEILLRTGEHRMTKIQLRRDGTAEVSGHPLLF